METNLSCHFRSALLCRQEVAKALSSASSLQGWSRTASSVAHVSGRESLLRVSATNSGTKAVEERTESELHASTSSPGPFPYDVADSEEKAKQRKKTRILMEILTAGEAVESVIQKHADEIDHYLLDLLDKRTRVAARLKEKPEAVAGLKLMHRRLAAELQRREASPALRLLHELLEVLTPAEGVQPEEQEEEVERLMRYAFQEPPAPHVDIFDTAARIASGEEVPTLEPDAEGHVPRHLFVWEAEALLREGTKNTQDLKRRMDRGHIRQHVAIYQHTLQIRMTGLQSLKRILDIAKRLDL